METELNNDGLGKDHDKAAEAHDIAKKQSDAKPGVENLDIMPNSVNKDGSHGFSDHKASNKQTEQSIKAKCEEVEKDEPKSR